MCSMDRPTSSEVKRSSFDSCNFRLQPRTPFHSEIQFRKENEFPYHQYLVRFLYARDHEFGGPLYVQHLYRRSSSIQWTWSTVSTLSILVVVAAHQSNPSFPSIFRSSLFYILVNSSVPPPKSICVCGALAPLGPPTTHTRAKYYCPPPPCNPFVFIYYSLFRTYVGEILDGSPARSLCELVSYRCRMSNEWAAAAPTGSEKSKKTILFSPGHFDQSSISKCDWVILRRCCRSLY